MNELRGNLKAEFADREYAHGYVHEFLSMRVATQIEVLRKQRGWTQQQLADLAGMSQERISRLENEDYRSYSVNTLQRLAEAFDLRLQVSFETFSSAIEEIVNFTPLSLERASRDSDLKRGVVVGVSEWNSKPKLRSVSAVSSVSSGVLSGAPQFALRSVR